MHHHDRGKKLYKHKQESTIAELFTEGCVVTCSCLAGKAQTRAWSFSDPDAPRGGVRDLGEEQAPRVQVHKDQEVPGHLLPAQVNYFIHS